MGASGSLTPSWLCDLPVDTLLVPVSCFPGNAKCGPSQVSALLEIMIRNKLNCGIRCLRQSRSTSNPQIIQMIYTT